MSIRLHRRGPILAVLALLLLSACQPTPTVPVAQQAVSAQLRTDGDAVFVNGRPARYGQTINQGDVVTTGAGSSALIRFSDGTTVQLDQNTDPVFSWGPQELQIRMAAGLIEVVKEAAFASARVVSGIAEVFSRSRFTVEVEPARSFRADLFSGWMGMERPQRGRVITPGQYILATADGQVTVGATSPSRVRELRRRLDRWEFARADQGPRVRIGIGGGVSRQPERQPQVEEKPLTDWEKRHRSGSSY